MAPTNVPRPKSAPTVAAVSELMAWTAEIGEIVVVGDLPTVSYQTTNRRSGSAGIHRRRQLLRRHASSTATPARNGSPTPEHAVLSTRQAQAPRSARRVLRS